METPQATWYCPACGRQLQSYATRVYCTMRHARTAMQKGRAPVRDVPVKAIPVPTVAENVKV